MGKKYDIVLSGVGIGGFSHTTPETLKALGSARVIYHLTTFHNQLRKYCNKVIDLDSMYWTGEHDEVVYKRIAEIVLNEAQKGPMVVMVSEGHPTIYDDIAWDIHSRGRNRGLKIKIIPAISSIDAMAAYCGLRINTNGFQIVEATSLVIHRQNLNPYMDTLVMQVGWFGTSLLRHIEYSKKGRFAPLVNYLLRFYPRKHQVQLFMAPEFEYSNSRIIKTELCLLDSHHRKDLSGMSLFIPALEKSCEIDNVLYHKTEELHHLEQIAEIKKNGE